MSAEIRQNRRREYLGVVISNKMMKTVKVQVVRKMRHPLYNKVIERANELYAHDETGTLQVGDKVRIAETRPLSKLKRWRVVEKV